MLKHRDEIPAKAQVELKVWREDTQGDEQEHLVDPKAAASIALLRSWIAEAPTDPEAIREAEEDLREFKRNMNLPRKETGAQLHFPEVE